MVLALVQHILVPLVKRKKATTHEIMWLHKQTHTMPLVYTALKTFFRSKRVSHFLQRRLAKYWECWVTSVHP